MSEQPYVHVHVEHDSVDVWLDPMQGGRFDGLCLGTGGTKAEAIADARESLRIAAEQIDRLEREA